MAYSDKKNPGDRLTSEDWNALAADVTSSVRRIGGYQGTPLSVSARDAVWINGNACVDAKDHTPRPLRVTGNGPVIALEGEDSVFIEFFPNGFSDEPSGALRRFGYIGFEGPQSPGVQARSLLISTEAWGSNIILNPAGYVQVESPLRLESNLYWNGDKSSHYIGGQMSSAGFIVLGSLGMCWGKITIYCEVDTDAHKVSVSIPDGITYSDTPHVTVTASSGFNTSQKFSPIPAIIGTTGVHRSGFDIVYKRETAIAAHLANNVEFLWLAIGQATLVSA